MNCRDCNIELGEHFYTLPNGERICDDCYMNDYFTCDDCGDVCHNDDGYTTNNGDNICYSCYENNYFTCDDCGEIFHQDYECYCEYDDCCYCESCYDRHNSSNIREYHDTDEFKFYSYDTTTNEVHYDGTTPRPDLIYLGYELEIEQTQRNDINDLAGYVWDKLPAQCSHDGSLSYGFEIVSHPYTLKAHESIRDKYRDTFKYLVDNGMRGDETSTCGLHVHVSREPLKEDTPDKIILFMENYKEELIDFARRGSNGYSRFLSDVEEFKDSVYVKSLEFIKKNRPSTRYMALNLTNRDTIEFRLFKSTLNVETFMATLNLVDNIVRVCNTTPVNKITWEKVVNYNMGEDLFNYLKRRDILETNTQFEDNSDTYEEYLKEEEKIKRRYKSVMKKELMKTLTKLHNEIKNSINNMSIITSLQRTEQDIIRDYNTLIERLERYTTIKFMSMLSTYTMSDDRGREMIMNVYNSCKN